VCVYIHILTAQEKNACLCVFNYKGIFFLNMDIYSKNKN